MGLMPTIHSALLLTLLSNGSALATSSSVIEGTIHLPASAMTDGGTPFVVISRKGEILHRATCEADGAFAIESPRDSRPFDMVAIATGCVPVCIAGLRNVNSEIDLELGSPSFFAEGGAMTADQIAEEVRSVFRRIEEADSMLPDTPEFQQILKSVSDSLVAMQPITVLVPAYFYPNGPALTEWSRLEAFCKGLRGNAVIIMNINSGRPTNPLDVNYINMAGALQKKRIRWIGYLSLQYGQADPNQVLAYARNWLQYPGCEGFFFDESPSRDAGKYEPLLKAIRQAMRLKRIRNPILIANPGTQTDDSFSQSGLFTDVCVLEESFGAVEYARPNWQTQSTDVTAGAILHDVGTEAKVRSAFREIAARRGSFVYFTDQIDGREVLWTRMPSAEILGATVDVVNKWNEGIRSASRNVEKLLSR